MGMGDNSILRDSESFIEADYYIQTTVQCLDISKQEIVRKINPAS